MYSANKDSFISYFQKRFPLILFPYPIVLAKNSSRLVSQSGKIGLP